MTCIVGLIDDARVYIGGDRLATTDGGRKFHRTDEKVWKKGPDMIFGAAGGGRGIQLLAYGSAIPPLKVGQDLKEYLTLDFVDAVKSALHQGGDLEVEDGIEVANIHFILGYDGRLFTFYGSFAFEEVMEKYTAVGSGAEFALGSLYATEDSDLTSEERIEMALEAAEYFNAFVKGPYDIVSIPRDVGDPVKSVIDKIVDRANSELEATD